MSTYITRRLPNSNRTRKAALVNAKQKNDSSPAENPFSATTVTRLDTYEPLYKAAMLQVNLAASELGDKTDEKLPAEEVARLFISNFIQTFNNGVALGIFPKSHRLLYGLPKESSNLPYLGNERALLTIGENIITGDAARIAKGGAPMAMLDIALFTTKFNAWKDLYIAHSNLTDALDTAREALTALNEEADRVIKKVWDEVETFYNEEVKESQRANAREWGVVYITVGQEEATINIELKSAITGANIPGQVYFSGPDATATIGASGIGSETTLFVGLTDATATSLGFVALTKQVTITEGGTANVLFEMTPM